MNNRYLVKTPFGYKRFIDISKNKKQCITIYFNDNTYISCSIDHPFIIFQNIIYARDLKQGMIINKKQKIVQIIKIENIGIQDCFDLIQVEDCHCYFTNNLISHNCFLGSAQTLINPQRLIYFKQLIKDKKKQYRQIQLHKDYEQTKIRMFVPPQKGRAYIIGADPSTGSQSDYHAMLVWDITDIYNIQLVAYFHKNNLPPKYFAYILAKTGTLYNKAYIAIENNGVSYATLDKLISDFEYQNVIHDGGSRMSIGIASSDDKKLDACLNFKQFLEQSIRRIYIYADQVLQQLQHFQKKSKQGKMPKFGCFSGNDDLAMSMIWSFYYLKSIDLQNLYDVVKYGTDKFGNQVPMIIASYQKISDEEMKRLITQIDSYFKSTTKSYNIQMQQLKYEIQKNQSMLMNNFISSRVIQGQVNNSINNNDLEYGTDQETFQFDGFIL